MQSVKLTVVIDDRADLDMEVRVVAPEAAATAVTNAPTTLRRPHVVPVARDAVDDEYTLGGYAGI